MNVKLARELAEGVLLLERLKRHLEFELSTPPLPFLRHAPSTWAGTILTGRLYFARGLDSGTNHRAPQRARQSAARVLRRTPSHGTEYLIMIGSGTGGRSGSPTDLHSLILGIKEC